MWNIKAMLLSGNKGLKITNIRVKKVFNTRKEASDYVNSIETNLYGYEKPILLGGLEIKPGDVDIMSPVKTVIVNRKEYELLLQVERA